MYYYIYLYIIVSLAAILSCYSFYLKNNNRIAKNYICIESDIRFFFFFFFDF